MIAAADWLPAHDDDTLHVAGSFCVLKSPAHLTIHLTHS